MDRPLALLYLRARDAETLRRGVHFGVAAHWIFMERPAGHAPTPVGERCADRAHLGRVWDAPSDTACPLCAVCGLLLSAPEPAGIGLLPAPSSAGW